MEWKKIFSNHIPDNGLITKIYKELILLNNKTKQNKNTWLKKLTFFSIEDLQMAIRYVKRCSASLVIREMRMKRMRQHFTATRTARVNAWTGASVGKDVERWRTRTRCWWECEMVRPLWGMVWWFLGTLNIVTVWPRESTPGELKTLHPSKKRVHKRSLWRYS